MAGKDNLMACDPSLKDGLSQTIKAYLYLGLVQRRLRKCLAAYL
jgi:hypothetical protein